MEADQSRVERVARERPDDARAHSGLGLTYAMLGMKGQAIGAGTRATELVPVSRDAYMGPSYLSDLARIYTLVGEPELAVDLLATLLSIPGDLSAGEIGLDPMWDALRDLPRFQELVGG